MENTREYWLKTMLKIATPVLDALSRDRLKAEMPVEARSGAYRDHVTHLEALGRTLLGIAPWLECRTLSGEEESLRANYAEIARRAIANGVDPNAKDHLNFSEDFQPIVDAAFLAHAVLRAPTELWEKLDRKTKQNLVTAMKQTRTRKPHPCNWLLFSAMIEAFLCFVGEADWDAMRIDYAINQHMQWYRGDSVYSDGPDVHIDYYNSFVIQPMLVDILETVGNRYGDWKARIPQVTAAFSRYAAVLEMLISPDGSYPVIGRSTAYRFGVFQALAQAALENKLPDTLSPAQVRCALTAVIKRVMAFEDNFDSNGWLTVGVCGHQPLMGENYISTGSLYLCTTVFLPLGLSPSAPFWSEADREWSAKKIWSGNGNVKVDHALTLK